MGFSYMRPLKLFLFLLFAIASHGQLTGAVAGTHDPAIAEDHGHFYVFATGDARPGQLPVRCSADLRDWTRCGAVFPEGVPAWITALSPQTRDLWAPDVNFYDGLYHLYYAFSVFGKRTSGIALVTSPTLEAPVWTDRGLVLQTTEHDDFNAIDPNTILDDNGDPWLAFGSYWSGIKLRRLDRATGLLDQHDKKQYSLAARSQGTAIEAPFLFRHEGFFYLFVSWDRCCAGAASTYRTVVGRAEKITGPYKDRDGRKMIDGGGTPVLTATPTWAGPGGASVLHLAERDVIVFHAYSTVTGRPWLRISTIAWQNGWPTATVDDPAAPGAP
jgi:arabinan endo-1,5-alpha-L-arabinosidase